MKFFWLLLEPFNCLFRQFELFMQLTKRSVELQHKGSHLGFLWSVLQPLMLLSVYVFVFGYIFNSSFDEDETRLEFGLNIFIGINCIHFITEIIAGAPLSVVSNPGFVKKVVFPMEILPAATVSTAFFHFMIGMVLVLVGLAFNGEYFSIRAFLFPLILIPFVFLGLGISWLLAALGVFFRDLNQLVPFFSIVLLFSSAVFYAPSDIPAEAYQYLKYNPVMHFIDLTRRCFVNSDPVPWSWVGYSYLVGLFVLQFGYMAFSRMKAAFADVI